MGNNLVRTHEQVLESHTAWPFTKRGSALVFGVATLLTVITIIALEVCDRDEECSRNAWPEEVFGEQRPFRNKTEKPAGWCELQRADHLMAEHANALSNLGFCAFGLLILACGIGDWVREGGVFPVLGNSSERFVSHRTGVAAEATTEKSVALTGLRRNHLVVFPVFSFVYGLSSVFLGIGSFSMHAYGSDFTQQLDVGGIFVVLAAPIFYMPLLFTDVNMSRIRLVTLRAVLLVLLFTTDILLVYFKYEIGTNKAMLGMIGVIVLGVVGAMAIRSFASQRLREAIYPGQITSRFRAKRLLAASALFMGIGFGVWTLDRNGVWCVPTSFLQGHGLWHLFCALAVLSLFFFLRSELIAYEQDNKQGGQNPEEEESLASV